MQGLFTFLGTGGSRGVPAVGCRCEVCASSSAYNKRRRCSALITLQNRRLLIDAGPEIREQILSSGIYSLDGVLLTHPHYDHIAGFDDLKGFYFTHKEKLPVLASKECYEEMVQRHQYLIETNNGKTEWAHFTFQILEGLFGRTQFAGMTFDHVSFSQTGTQVTGIKIGNLAYLSDLKDYTDELITKVSGIDILIVSALRPTTSPMHFSIDEAIEFSKKIKAKKTYFTHLAHDLEYVRDSKLLPKDIAFAYDGLEIPFHYEGALL